MAPFPYVRPLLRFARFALMGALAIALAASPANAATQPGPSFVVNTLADTDDGSADLPGQGTGNKDCTLREAINAANTYGDGATITFGLSGPITLSSELPTISRGMTIDGSGQSVVISGNNSVPVFSFVFATTPESTPKTVNFNALTIAQAQGSAAGGLSIRRTIVNVTNCTFRDNVCFSPGGAIRIGEGSTVTVANCTFDNNVGAYGGGIFVSGFPAGAPSVLRVFFSTFANNRATFGAVPVAGTGVHVETASAEVRSSIFVRGNTGANWANCVGVATLSNNIANDTSAGGTALSAAQINLQPLAQNGGPTPTMALGAGSVAISAADPAVALAPPVDNFDQRGFGRVGGGDATADAGAYEAAALGPSAAAPTFSPSPGTYPSPTTVTLASTTPGASIYYTTNGTLPSAINGTLYTGPILVSVTTSFRAVTVAAGFSNSASVSGTYTIVPETPSLVVDLASDLVDVFDRHTSLREAVAYAASLGGAQTITFAPALAGQTVTLASGWNSGADDTALRVNAGSLTLTGPVNGVTLAVASGTTRRHFYVATGATLSLSNLTLAGGGPSNPGGAVYNDGTLSATACTFSGNSAGEAGAIQSMGTLSVTACTFSGNASAFNGGALRLFGTANLSGSTFTGNTVANEGGALISFGDLTATNCTFANNGKKAVLLWDGTADLRHVTVAYNLDGGLVRVNATTTLRHSIVAGNSGFDVSGTLDPASSNNVLNVSAAVARLGLLAANGGPTQTVALLAGSPGINLGVAIVGVPTDQRGVARPQYGTPDAGAFEYDGGATDSLVVTTTVDEDDTTSDPLFGAGTSLREALAYANTLSGPHTITFAPSVQGQTIALLTHPILFSDSALITEADVTIDGGAGVTITNGSGQNLRLISNFTPGRLTLIRLILAGWMSDFSGGAVESDGPLVVQNCAFANNHARRGGAIYSRGELTVTASIFLSNTAITEGGAVRHSPSSGFTNAVATLANCTFVDNTASLGAALSIEDAANVFCDHLTITDNLGATAMNVEDAIVTMRNCVVARNELEGALTTLDRGTGTFTAASANNFVAGTAWTGLNPSTNTINVNPAALRLGTLASNGGPTQTIALLPGSPLINSGVAISGITTDQRGLARSVGGAPDIGALEDATGDDDPDRDSLTNFAEFQLTTNPLALDTDGDGFNDATESMNGSNPTLGTSLPGATRIERVLGLGPARGLDLTGTFLYAVNVGTNGAPGQIGEANFTADTVAGVTVTAPFEVANWSVRDFGSTAQDDRLEQVFGSVRFHGPTPGLQVNAANLVPGRNYQLQLLFVDAPAYTRAFDVAVNGTNIVPLYNTNLAQGANLKPYAASAIVHTFTAASSALNVTLSNTGTGAFDPNPILNGFTLEEIPTAASAPLISPASGTYTGSVTVSIATPAPGATIRYTLDGSAPSETVGAIYNGAFTLNSSATVRAIASGGGWLTSPISSASYTVQTAAQAWRLIHGLPADGSQDFANPSGDGVDNLQKYAFNLAPNPGDLLNANVSILPSNGTAGLPALGRDAQGRLVIEFIRRKAATQPAITYLVETGADVTSLQPLDLGGAIVVSIDANWERVTVIDPVITPGRLGRVRVNR